MLNQLQSVPIARLNVKSFTIPTDFPESDGTFEWDRTTIVLVEASGGGKRGLGYTYADTATATLIHDTLAPYIPGMDAMSPPAVYKAMWRLIRNHGRPGICSMAISAVDCALWDLKARLLGVPLVTLLGQV
ncbi:MAG TPA: mandelate racemase, partial [Candidatus Angelobacter sp.]|nr:mandelate racemase [Candidatus Angelobacter sp.]